LPQPFTVWSKATFQGLKVPAGGGRECKINFGPGYRIYFGQDGEELVILLGGGSKKRQNADIPTAWACWQDYKGRKRQEAGAMALTRGVRAHENHRHP